MQADRKACATNTGSKPKIYINAGAISNAFGISDSTENAQKMQCFKCNPPLHKPPGAMKLCPNCEAEAEQMAITFFDNFRYHHKVIKLDRYCFACSSPKSEALTSEQFRSLLITGARDVKQVNKFTRTKVTCKILIIGLR